MPTQGATASSVRDGEPGHASRAGLLQALGMRVRQRRELLGLTRKALSGGTGLSPRFIAQLESGKGNISVANLNNVAQALRVSLTSLLTPSPAIWPAEREALRYEVERLLARCDAAQLGRVAELLRLGTPSAEVGARRVIALMGLRGAGKSTIGPLLAARLEMPYLELDDVIQETSGLAIPEIFELHGEQYYRQAERKALQHLVERGQRLVVAVSGGIVADAESFALLKRHTTTVWLKATPELYMQRVRSQGDNRPMRDRPDAMAELRRLLAARGALYAQAQIVVDTALGSAVECAEALAARLRQPLAGP